MSLGPRQVRLYRHKADIWRQTNPTNTDGTKGAPGWDKIASNVTCFYAQTRNINDETEGIGRGKRMNDDTLDIVHFEQTQDVKANDILKNVTVGSKLNGVYHRIEGSPRIIDRPAANFLEVDAMEEEKPPPAVTV